MSASSQNRHRPVSSGAVDTRLPWWALALPALAFVFLLSLILHPAEAQTTSAEPVLTHLIERAQQLFGR